MYVCMYVCMYVSDYPRTCGHIDLNGSFVTILFRYHVVGHTIPIRRYQTHLMLTREGVGEKEGEIGGCGGERGGGCCVDGGEGWSG